ncbi:MULTISPECIES: homoserine dehydrogenase [unclassified Archaeoglobus]|jgi:homoserine dehydrogenase|uniref:homoserine dehydrogenase n=1 Tax=unclassified Archaeoglobus TaxID=2643606 RepID=UPI0025BA3141|nr:MULTISPECIES: homoserine dehydrogenase [unclassified Archaeoglobus]
MIRIAIVGFGTVGQGFAELLERKREEIRKKIGEFKVVAIADSKSSISGEFSIDEAIKMKREEGRLRDDRKADELIDEVDFDILVEATHTKLDGGSGLSYIKKALKKGSHVITSNKGPLVADFEGLMTLAEKKGVKLMYEATVGGAMPVIKLIKRYLAFCEIESVRGILNGTCNYILSRMEEEGLPYEQILNEAQELGIAEADPTYDVEGIDAAAKLIIIANTIGVDAKFEDVERVGIRKITPEAFNVAEEKGYTIRLIAEVSKETLRVSPRLVPLSHPLAIKGTMNATMFKTDTAGNIFVAGRGAGKEETASAMLSDLYDIYVSN